MEEIFGGPSSILDSSGGLKNFLVRNGWNKVRHGYVWLNIRLRTGRLWVQIPPGVLNIYCMLIKSYSVNTQIEDFLELIKKDCQPFIKLLRENRDVKTWSGSTKPLLYRGMKNRVSDFIKEETRKDRRSLDTGRHIDINKLDDMYEHKFGVRPRTQGIFCSFDTTQADRYGDLFIIFPIGNFDYLVSDYWQDTMDAFLFYIEDSSDIQDDKEIEEFYKKYGKPEEGQSVPDKFVKEMIIDRTFFNKNIDFGIEQGTETIFICDEFYAIRDKGEYYHKIKNFIYV